MEFRIRNRVWAHNVATAASLCLPQQASSQVARNVPHNRKSSRGRLSPKKEESGNLGYQQWFVSLRSPRKDVGRPFGAGLQGVFFLPGGRRQSDEHTVLDEARRKLSGAERTVSRAGR
jgi:hypothetical protein